MKILRILYCVHRYAPFPGGSENYVRDLAEETLQRGHDVSVFAGEHAGNLNGVKVTSDPRCIYENWDLIVVHGGDVQLQNYVLASAGNIPSPILYLLILPSTSPTCVRALHEVTFIGCSTPADWRHVQGWGPEIEKKCSKIPHSINPVASEGSPGFCEKYGIDPAQKLVLSCGGFWPNKGFGELIEIFNQANRPDMTLVLTGYDDRHGIMPRNTENVKALFIEDRTMILSALREADLYVMNSTAEGFGLVLLEAMWNCTPWAARKMAGAELMQEYGFTYETNEELLNYLKNYRGVSFSVIEEGYRYVKQNHLNQVTVDAILRLVIE